MPSYAEDLIAQPERYHLAIEGLIAEQVAIVGQIAEDLERARRSLDRAVLRLAFVAEAFGRGSSDAVSAQHVAEDANTRVAELSGRLERNEMLLRLFQSKLTHTGSARIFDGGTSTAPPLA